MNLCSRRRQVTVRIACVLLGVAAIVANCSDKGRLPEFPEYPPTAPFLEEQEQRKRRALAFAEYQRRERIKYGAKNQEENLASWLPIYNRVEMARKTRHLRDEARAEAFRQFQEQTKATWLPVQTRIFVSRETRPQREAADQEQVKQFQEETKATWLPHQTQVFVHRETRDQRELEAMIKKRREARYPSGTRLLNPDGTIQSAP